MKTKMISFFLKLIFYQAPKIVFSNQEIKEYNKIFEEAMNGNEVIRYTSSYPKYRFIVYISISKNVLIHGSNNKFIHEFESRRQTLNNGEHVEGVFATKDGIWPVFYAVFDKSKLQGNIRNACLKLRKGSKFHYYSITQESNKKWPWINGMIYFLPMNTFNKVSDGIVYSDEWISKESVVPIARIEVSPGDFYFLSKVAVHKSNEPLIKTCLMYKLRLIFRNDRT